MTNNNNHKTELPAGWVWTKIDELISEQGVFCDGDWVESKDQDPNGDVRLIQLADVGDGSFKDKSNRFLTSEKARELNCTYLEKGDILVARLPDPLGRACIFPLEGKGKYVTVVDVCIVRPETNDINSKYLLYVINSPQTRTEVDKYKSGSTRKRISRTNFARIEFPLPPLAEQQRIVDKIEELFSDLDHSVAALETARAQLDIYRQAVLKHAFEGKLTELWRQQHQPPPAADLLAHIQTERKQQFDSKSKYQDPTLPDTNELAELPTGWIWVSLDQLTSLITSGSRGWAKYYSDHGAIFIRAQDIKTDALNLDTVAHVDLPNRIEGSRTRVAKDDLLVTITGANVTKTALVKQQLDEAYVNQHVALIRPVCGELSPYLYFWIISPAQGRRQLEKHAYGMGKPGLNLTNLRELVIALPSLAEQRAIVDEIEARLSVVDKLAETIDTALHQAEALRQSILKQAFAGKLVPQNADDEPAEVLLERIKRQ